MKDYIAKSIKAKQEILEDEVILNDIMRASEIIIQALKSGKKVLFAGNGGSASDCNHLATELVSKFYKQRKALNAISLCANNSLITAIANDFGSEHIFERQIEAHGAKGDVAIFFSTSGMSKNIIKALKKSADFGLIRIGFCGKSQCDMDGLCDILIKVPSLETPIIQESHIMLGHLLCKMVEEA